MNKKPFDKAPEPNLKFQLNNMTDEKVSIIVVHRDKPAFLNLCLQSIAAVSLNTNYEIIVVDDASESVDAKDFISDLETQDCKVIRNQSRMWWTKSVNLGAKAADPASKYLIFLHHDIVILNPGWIDILISVSDSEDAGLVGVSMSSYGMEDIEGKETQVEYVEEWCMLTTRECWQDCGPFDEKLEQVGGPFMYTITANYQNYKPQVIKNTLVKHYETFAMDLNDLEKFNEKAMAVIPSLIRDQQNRVIQKVK
jgi:glycosyltransferase involved in cell wall biosynthesis